MGDEVVDGEPGADERMGALVSELGSRGLAARALARLLTWLLKPWTLSGGHSKNSE